MTRRNVRKQGWVFPLFSPDSDDRLSLNFHRFVILYISCDTRSVGLGQYCLIPKVSNGFNGEKGESSVMSGRSPFTKCGPRDRSTTDWGTSRKCRNLNTVWTDDIHVRPHNYSYSVEDFSEVYRTKKCPQRQHSISCVGGGGGDTWII